MNQVLTKEIAYKELQGFFCQTPFVLFGTGTSCAVDIRFGMEKLKDHLLDALSTKKLNPNQQSEWEMVTKQLNDGYDLEFSMNAVQDEGLTQIIVGSAAKLVSSLDQEYSTRIFSGETKWPAAHLFELLVDGLSPTNPVLHVATPNYDLLAEYAFDNRGIFYITGFHGGICRQRNWEYAERSMRYMENAPRSRRSLPLWKVNKHIRLYKVHGSLNTFCINNAIVENNAWMYRCPDQIERIMITPGTSKFKQLHRNRSDLLLEFDRAVEKHDSFLFIGFGFNDSQLCNNTIKRKLKEQKCPGLIITRSSNSRIDEYLKECENLWVVCMNEEDSEGTSIYNSQYQNPINISDKKLWNPCEFANEILGG